MSESSCLLLDLLLDRQLFQTTHWFHVLFSALATPPGPVKLTLEAVAVLMGEGAATSWADLRRFVQRKDFISLIVNYESSSLTPSLRAQLMKNYLSNEDFNFERVNNASKACGPLCAWVVSQVQKHTDLIM